MKKKLRKRFIEFLKEERCYDKFIANYTKGPSVSLRRYLKNTVPSQYIYSAFYWDTTPEGIEYWLGVQKKWVGLL